MQGTILEFDEARGLGTVRAAEGDYPFHCTALIDGTRTIEVDVEVTFSVRPGPGGRWEATAVERVA